MEVICGRDCRKAIGGKCIREALKIDSSGICTGYESTGIFTGRTMWSSTMMLVCHPSW